MYSTFCLFFLLVAQSLYYSGPQRSSTYETGFASDFRPATPTIDIVEVAFTGNLAYTDTGHLYIDLGKDGVRSLSQSHSTSDSMPRGSYTCANNVLREREYHCWELRSSTYVPRYWQIAEMDGREMGANGNSSIANPNGNVSHGYIHNDDALLPWDRTESEFQ
ncbi:hypothetical protein B7463_g1498, partial [Scytalidium lignicola]